MQTLLKAEGYYNASYRDIADVIRRISVNPGQDLIKLFKQMVFNVMVGNTDDHLKNLSMIFDREGWKLSPAYDLVLNVGMNSEHVLRIGYYNVVANRKVLIDEAKYFDIKQPSKADKIISAMFSVVSNWGKIFKEFDVPYRDIEIIGKDIEVRMAKIKC